MLKENKNKMIDYKKKEMMNIISNNFKFQIKNVETESRPRRWIQIEKLSDYNERIRKEIQELNQAMKHPYANLTFEDFEDLMGNPDEYEKFAEYMEREKQRLQKRNERNEMFYGTVFEI